MADNTNNTPPMRDPNNRGFGINEEIFRGLSALGSLPSELKGLADAVKKQSESINKMVDRNEDFRREFLRGRNTDEDKTRGRGRFDSELTLSRNMSSMADNLKDLSRDLRNASKSARDDSWRMLPQSKMSTDIQYLSAKRQAEVLDEYTKKIEELNKYTDERIKAHNLVIADERARSAERTESRKAQAADKIQRSESLINELKVKREETTDPNEIASITKKIQLEQVAIEKERVRLEDAIKRIADAVDTHEKEGIETILADAKQELDYYSEQRKQILSQISDTFSKFEESANNVQSYTASMRGLSPAFAKMMDDVDETYSEGFNKTKDTLLAGIEEEKKALIELLKADERETDARKKLNAAEKEKLKKEFIILKKQEEYLKKTSPIQDIWKSAGTEMLKAGGKIVEGFADLGFHYLEDKYFKSYQEGFQKVYDAVENARNSISARLKMDQGAFSEMQEQIYAEIEGRGLSGSLSQADVDEMVVSLSGAGITDEDMLTELAIEGAKLKAQGSSINLGNEKTLQLLKQMYDTDVRNGATQEEALNNMRMGIDDWAAKEIYVRQQYGDAALVNGGIDTLINTVGDLWESTGQATEEGFKSIGDSFITAQKMYSQGYDATEYIQAVQGMLDKQYSEYSALESINLQGGLTRDKILSQSLTDSLNQIYDTQKTLLDSASDMYLPEVSNAYGLVGSMQDQRKMKAGERLDLTTSEDIQQTLNEISETESEALKEGRYLSETERVRNERENTMTGQAIEAEQMYKGDMLVNGTLNQIDATVNSIYNILKLSVAKTATSMYKDFKKGKLLGGGTDIADDISDGVSEVLSDSDISESLSLPELLKGKLGVDSIGQGATQFLTGKSGTVLGAAGKLAGEGLGAYWMVDSIKDNLGDSFAESFENIGTDPQFYRGLGTTLGSAIAGPVGGAIGGVIGQAASQIGNALGDKVAEGWYDWFHDTDLIDAQIEAANHLLEAGKALDESAKKQAEEIQGAQQNIVNQKQVFAKYDENMQKQFITQMGINDTDISTQEAFQKAIQKWEQIELKKIDEMNLKQRAAEGMSVLSAAMDTTVDGSLFEASKEVQDKKIQEMIDSGQLTDEAIIKEFKEYGSEWLTEKQMDAVDKIWKAVQEQSADMLKVQTKEGYDELAVLEEQALRDYAEKNNIYDASGALDLNAARSDMSKNNVTLDLSAAAKKLYSEQLASGALTEEDVTNMTSYFQTMEDNRRTWEEDNRKFQSRWEDVRKKNPGKSVVELVDAYNKEYLDGKGISVSDVIDGFTVDDVGLLAQYTMGEGGNPILRSTTHGGTRMYDPSIYHNKFESGLTEVPYDLYPALLHQGERILTKEEASAYNEMSSYAIRNLNNNDVSYGDSTVTNVTKVGTESINRSIKSQTETTKKLLSNILATLQEISMNIKTQKTGNPINSNVRRMNSNLTAFNT